MVTFLELNSFGNEDQSIFLKAWNIGFLCLMVSFFHIARIVPPTRPVLYIIVLIIFTPFSLIICLMLIMYYLVPVVDNLKIFATQLAIALGQVTLLLVLLGEIHAFDFWEYPRKYFLVLALLSMAKVTFVQLGLLFPQTSVLKFLIGIGGDLRMVYPEGRTPLIQATRKGKKKAVQVILEEGRYIQILPHLEK